MFYKFTVKLDANSWCLTIMGPQKPAQKKQKINSAGNETYSSWGIGSKTVKGNMFTQFLVITSVSSLKAQSDSSVKSYRKPTETKRSWNY